MKKKLKKLIIGIVAITAVISIIPVKAAKATDTFSITNSGESIYRVADKKYITDSYNDSANSWNKDNDIFFDILRAPQVKKDAYEIAYSARMVGIEESAKAYRYFLCGGEDGLEESVFYTEKGDFYTKKKKESGNGILDRTWVRDLVDEEILTEQQALKGRYSGYKNLDKYNLNGLGANAKNKLYLINMDELLKTNTNARNFYKGNIEELSKFIINNKGSIPNNGNQIQVESSDSGITVLESKPNENVQINWGIDDWYYAIGGSRGDILSKVSVKNYGTSSMYYEVELNYCLQDMYKWPGTRTWEMLGITMNESELNKLHGNGMSQDYRMFGSYKDTIRVYPNGQITCKDKNSGAYVSLENKTY